MKDYILATSIGTFKLTEELNFSKEAKKEKGTLIVNNITELGLESVINLNLEKVELLGYYIIDQAEPKGEQEESEEVLED